MSEYTRGYVRLFFLGKEAFGRARCAGDEDAVGRIRETLDDVIGWLKQADWDEIDRREKLVGREAVQGGVWEESEKLDMLSGGDL